MRLNDELQCIDNASVHSLTIDRDTATRHHVQTRAVRMHEEKHGNISALWTLLSTFAPTLESSQTNTRQGDHVIGVRPVDPCRECRGTGNLWSNNKGGQQDLVDCFGVQWDDEAIQRRDSRTFLPLPGSSWERQLLSPTFFEDGEM